MNGNRRSFGIYTLVAFDTHHDLLHSFDIERTSNKIYRARWSVDEQPDEKDAYKKTVYLQMQRWFQASCSVTTPEHNLQCDLNQVEEQIAWSQITDF